MEYAYASRWPTGSLAWGQYPFDSVRVWFD